MEEKEWNVVTTNNGCPHKTTIDNCVLLDSPRNNCDCNNCPKRIR